MTLLDLILLVPAAGFLVALFLPKDKPALVRNFALIVALVTFALLIPSYKRKLAGLMPGRRRNAASLRKEFK